MITEYHRTPSIPNVNPNSKWLVLAVCGFAIAGGIVSGYTLFF
jgi:hypothetical protein